MKEEARVRAPEPMLIIDLRNGCGSNARRSPFWSLWRVRGQPPGSQQLPERMFRGDVSNHLPLGGSNQPQLTCGTWTLLRPITKTKTYPYMGHG